MAPTNPPSTGIAAGLNWDLGRPVDKQSPYALLPSIAEEKKASVAELAIQKMALYGNPEQQRVAAISENEGTRLTTEDQAFRDMREMSYADFVHHYGYEAAQKRAGYIEALWQARRDKDPDQTQGQQFRDTGLGLGQGAAGLIGGAGTLATAIVDAAFDTETSPTVSGWTQGISDWLQSKKTESGQANADYRAVASELKAQDRDAQFLEDLEAGAGSDSLWDQAVRPILLREGRGLRDAFKDGFSSTAAANDTIAQAVGSFIPVAKGAQAAGKSLGLMAAMRQGIKDPKKLREIIQAETEKAAVILGGMAETGGVIHQSQVDILSMPEEELAQSPDYQALLAQGMSPDDARTELAGQAGRKAGLMGAPGAVLGAKITAPLVAAPLRVTGAGKLPGSTVIGDLARETVEETFQETNAQLAANIAAQGIGLDRDLTEGLGEAAGQGAAGGLGAAGAIKAGGAAKAVGDAALAVPGAVGSAVASGIQGVKDARAAEADASNPLGSTAQQAAGQELQGNTEALIESLAPAPAASTDPSAEASTEAPTQAPTQAPAPIADRLREAVLAEPETAGFLRPPSEEGATPAPMTRAESIQMLGQLFDAAEDTATKLQMASAILSDARKLRTLDNDETQEAVNALPEDHPAREALAGMRAQLATVEASPAIQQAQEFMSELSGQELDEALPLDLLSDPETAAEIKDYITSVLSVATVANPQLKSSAEYQKILDQLTLNQSDEVIDDDDGTNNAATGSYDLTDLRSTLTGARDAAAVFEQMEETKAGIDEETEAKGGTYRTKGTTGHRFSQQEVSGQIHEQGNQNNNLLSLKAHRTKVALAAQSGRLEEAKAAAQDLSDFAQTLANKVDAFNQSAEGKGDKTGRVGYEAAGPYGWFYQEANPEDQKGVYANLGSANSLALIREVQADAQAAAGILKALNQQFDLGLNDVQVPELSSRIGSAKPPSKPKTKPKTKPRAWPKKKVSKEASEALARIVGARRKQIQDARLQSSRRKAVRELNQLIREADGKDDASLPEGHQERLAEARTVLDRIEEEMQAAGLHVPARRAPAGLKKPVKPAESPAEKTEAKAEVETEAKTGVKAEPKTEPKKEESVTTKVETEAKIEPETKTDVEEKAGDLIEAPAKTWLANLKPLLLKSWNGAQNFLDAFRPRKEGSTLPALSNQQEIIDWFKKQIAVPGRPQEQIDALTYVIEEVYPVFANGLQNRVDALIEKNNWDTPEKLGRAMGFPNALPLNFLIPDPQNEGKFILEPRVTAATFMATYEWLLMNSSPPRKMDDEEINKMLGRPRTARVTDPMRDGALYGVPFQRSAEMISNKIADLLGVTARKTEDVRFSQGLFRAMATNGIEQLMDPKPDMTEADKGNLIRWIQMDRSVAKGSGIEHTTTTMLRVRERFTKNPDNHLMILMRDPFTRILTPGREKARYVGEPPKIQHKTKVRNQFNTLSKAELKAQTRLQNIPNYMNTTGVNLLRAMGEDNLKQLFGLVPLTAKNRGDYSVGSLRSLEGKNQTIENDLQGVLGYLNEIEGILKTGHKDYEKISDVPIFFDWQVSSVARLQQQGPVTPQGSKIGMFFMNSTWSTLDLKGDMAPLHEIALWYAVAQSLGTKIEKMDTQSIIEAAREQVLPGGKYHEAVQILENWLKSPEEKFPFQKLKAAVGGTIEPTELHALLTVAEFNVAVERDDETFQTSLGLEADGKTDGPVNAMIHMGLGDFEPKELELFAKGGLFFTDQRVSLNDFVEWERRSGHDRAGEDIYHAAASLFGLKLNETLKDLSPEAAQGRLKTMSVLNSFLPDFSMALSRDENGVLTSAKVLGEIHRNIVKNPLTVFLYGSGDAGIAGKIAKAVIGELDQLLTELIALQKDGKTFRDHPKFKEDPGLLNDLAAVLTNGDTAALARWLQKPATATVNSDMEKSLQQFIHASFVTPMIEAIDETTGGLQTRMKFQQAVAQIHTTIFQRIFDDRIKKAQDTKKAERVAEQTTINVSEDGKPRKVAQQALLSEQEILDIFLEVMKIAPIYGSEDQSFHISAATKAVDDRTKVSESTTGRLKSFATYAAPSDASVKVSPYLTIGNGDGKMILNIYVNGDGDFETSLPIFDGVMMALDKIDSASEQINRETFNAWMEANPYEALEQGFGNMLSHMTTEDLNLLTKDDQKVFGNLAKEHEIAFHSTGDLLRNFHLVLKDAAEAKRHRIAVMKRMATSADHMAGAQMPAQREGEAIPGGNPTDYAQLAQRMNQMLREEEAKAQEEAKTRRANKPKPVAGYAQGPVAELVQSVEEIGTVVEGHERVRRMPIRALMGLMLSDESKTGASKEQKGILKDLAQLVRLDDSIMVYFGEASDLEALRNDFFSGSQPGGMNLPKDRIQLGQTYSRDPVIFIANISPETVAHELLHKFTAETLARYYADPQNAPQHVRLAVQQLEKLMKDVQDLNIYGMSLEEEQALKQVKSEIKGFTTDPTKAMTEFISYVLTNQHLIEKAKKTPQYRTLGTILKDALRAVMKMLNLKGNPGETLYSNVRYSTRMLVAQAPVQEATQLSDIQDMIETNLILDQAFGADAHLEHVERTYLTKLDTIFKKGADPALNKVLEAETQAALSEGRLRAYEANKAGFGLNAREIEAFRAVHAVVSSKAITGPVHRHLYEAYAHVVQELTEQDLLDAMGIGPNSSVQALTQAKAMYDHIVGSDGIKAAGKPREVMATFLALSQTSQIFRDALTKVKPPKVLEWSGESMDEALQSAGRTAVNLISRASLTPRKMAPNLQKEIDLLSATLSQIQEDRHALAAVASATKLHEQWQEMIDTGNDYVSSKLQKYSDKTTTALEDSILKNPGSKLNGAKWVASMLTALGSKDASKRTGDELTKLINKSEGLHTLRSFLSDLRGLTEDNEPIMRLVNPVRAFVDKVRQEARTNIPETIEKAFTRPLTKQEWSQMTQAVAKADLLSMGPVDAMKVLQDPAFLRSEIRRLERELAQMSPNVSALYQTKAQALARYMVLDEQPTSRMLYRNAYAMARLIGDPREQIDFDGRPDAQDIEDALDKLISLYAYDLLDQGTKDSMKALATTEVSGMEHVTGFMDTLRKLEGDKARGNMKIRLNGWKGYVPSLPQQGSVVIVANASEHAYWTDRGYTRMGRYHGDSSENRHGSRSQPRYYYQTTVGGKGAFRQGIAQTVHDTGFGVSAYSGHTLGGQTAGVYLGSSANQLARTIARGNAGPIDGLAPGEYLLPVFGEKKGQLEVARYERAMDPQMLRSLNKEDNLSRLMGVWMGRILEEEAAHSFNQEVVQATKEIYDKKAKEGDLSGFINIADKNQKDPVIRDAWNTLGWRIKEEIAEVFGPEQFWVRKDMVDDVIGFRSATLTDAWTGVSRWSPATQKAVLDVAHVFMGDKAFKTLRKAETVMRDAVSWAKTTIIVKSFVVARDNIVSNFLHLWMSGVPIASIVQGSRDKFSEIVEYVKNDEEISRLQVKMAAAAHHPRTMARYEAQIKALQEANDGLSIAPLIQWGEFSTISEDLTETDVAIREGKWGDYIEQQIQKLPGPGSTVAKNLLISKDTALFQGLNRMVSYGDFIAKAVLYDHLKKKGKSDEEIRKQIFDEFVPYNRLGGRSRDAIEALGMAWFLNYKIRITKVLLRSMRDRPISALFTFAGLGPSLGVDTVWSGSGIGAAESGRIWYSLGPEMGFNAPSMHPVLGLAAPGL